MQKSYSVPDLTQEKLSIVEEKKLIQRRFLSSNCDFWSLFDKISFKIKHFAKIFHKIHFFSSLEIPKICYQVSTILLVISFGVIVACHRNNIIEMWSPTPSREEINSDFHTENGPLLAETSDLSVSSEALDSYREAKAIAQKIVEAKCNHEIFSDVEFQLFVPKLFLSTK